MILAAGFGTRLAGLGLSLPKPLFPVCNVPLVRWAVSFLAGHGVTEIVVNLHHRGELLREVLGDGSSIGVRILYSEEEGQILGTGGGVRHALPLLQEGDEPFVLMNGKIVSDVDLFAALRHHRATGAAATMVVVPDPEAARWGAIGVDAEGRVRRLLGAPEPQPGGDGTDLGEHMFTGIHLLDPRFVASLPEGPSCIVRAGYRPALDRGVPLGAYLHQGYFWEHSTPERWLRGNLNLVKGLAPDSPSGAEQGTKPAVARFPPGPLRGVDPSARIAKDATLDAAVLVGPGAEIGKGVLLGPGVVVGPRARVDAGSSLANTLVLEGARASGSVENAVITPDGLVHGVDPMGPGPRTGPALGAASSGS
jgi:NDP-sugar pyrophosphorylase family protein